MITSLETFVVGPICVVRVRSADGLEGYGQCAPGEAAITSQVLHRLVAPLFLGREPFELAGLADRCVRAQYKFLGTFLFRALGGVDTAIYDLQGKALQLPVYRLLGAHREPRVRLYASSMSRETSPEDEVDRLHRAVETFGFRCAKLKIGVRNGRDLEERDGRTYRVVPLARERLGTIELSADANGAYSPVGAVRVGRLLESQGYFHFEEPNPCWELDNMAEVARSLDIAIGAGEQEYSIELIRRMIAEPLVDVIQPDICYLGGVTRARRVAEMADVAGMPCMPHCSNRSLVQIFTAHFAAAMPACSQFQEWSIEEQGNLSGFYDPVPVPKEGEIVLDDTPGWGVELRTEFLGRADRRVTTLEDLNGSAGPL